MRVEEILKPTLLENLISETNELISIFVTILKKSQPS
jgi:hypothetical protein